ncbi:unnamed protein product [Prorocentrum cordatum]|uniref:Microcin J25-processing protein McjB C-terminal domain-containing protein n=1 Tax=Prorocentrum cordatum TaxID=2364126 RepID=A0ABN9XL51_9DINO|nr:unnamed protein product [Polarella glacialis]
MKGKQSSLGDQTGAAQAHANPDFGRVGGRKLPHAWRSLEAWRRPARGRQHKASALAVWCGLVLRLAYTGHLRHAVFVTIGTSAHSRPLHCWQLDGATSRRLPRGPTATVLR